MATRTGRDALFDVLASEGVSHVFGNPGTTELPLMDALVDHDEFHYVLGLQEAVVVGMADGYAQASGHRREPPSIAPRSSATARPTVKN